MAIKYVNAKKDLTATTLTTLYTAPTSPATTSIVKSLIVSEDAGATPNITITLVDTADTPATFNLFKTKALTANSTLELLTQPLVLTAGEILKVQASAANQIHVVSSIMEVTDDIIK
jgi:hypothetical protein|tara:strand:+ start:688 stop:1038 length:351 start_codon:yes stop_codon:yes gene_type:complete